MNLFLDFVPSNVFLQQLEKLKSKLSKDDNIVLNMYVKQLPAMNINKSMYMQTEECIKIIEEIKKEKMKANIMLDTFCYGNKEFTNNGKNILETLEKIFAHDIDYITIVNNFFFNYVKRRYKKVKIIMSEYTVIDNAQKINRYLEDMKADSVKIDFNLALNNKKMEYIKENFNPNSIHIDMKKIYYINDIYRDSLYNSLSHYIQEEKWNEIHKCIQEYEKNKDMLDNKKVSFNKNNLNNLKEMGYTNFWYYNMQNTENYIDDVCKFIT